MLLSVVIPVYNSENTIKPLVQKLEEVFVGLSWEVILVNDGSEDNSEKICHELAHNYENVKFISLRKNFGEYNAVHCGLSYCEGQYCVIIDDDFQNPPAEIQKLIETAQVGNYDVVYSYYADKQHSTFRNMGSWIVNRLTTWLLEKPKDLYLSSFKLITLPVVKEIVKYQGPYPYIEGLIFRITRNIGRVEVQHDKRQEGKSGYTLRKLTSLFMTVAFGYSLKPIRLVTGFGILVSVLSLILMIAKSIELFQNNTFEFLEIFEIVVIVLGGIMLTTLGMIGEYVGRTYMNTSGLSAFIVKEREQQNLKSN